MKSRGGQISRLIFIPCLPDPSVGGKCRLCSGMFIPQEQEVQDSSPVKGQQGQFMLFFFFFHYLAPSSLSCSTQAAHCIMRRLPWWYPGSPVVAAYRLSSCAVRTCLWHVGCGVSVPQPGIKPALQGRLLTTGPPRKSPNSCFQGTEFRATSKTQLNESQALTSWIHFCLLWVHVQMLPLVLFPYGRK